MAENDQVQQKENAPLICIKDETKESDDVLIGPPEICLQSATTTAAHAQQISSDAPSLTVEACVQDSAEDGLISDDSDSKGVEDVDNIDIVRMGRTENDSATFLSSGNACLNFFFQVVPSSPPEAVIDLLANAWKEDPLMALKLVFQLRGVRGKGKTDKQNFYIAAIWLHERHPRTLLANIDKVAAFGYYKDLPEILLRIVEGAEGTAARLHRKSLFEQRTSPFGSRMRDTDIVKSEKVNDDPKKLKKEICKAIDRCSRKGCSICKETLGEFENLTIESKNCTPRSRRRIAQATKAVKAFNEDPAYRILYNAVAKFFAEQLKKDIFALNEGKSRAISLAAKWCPSLDASYDRTTLLCEGIARKFYRKAEYPEYRELDDRAYAYRIRDRMRKEVLVPLREALKLPEVSMSANAWKDVIYKRVASVAMKNYKKLFLKHDEARFKCYLEEVSQGKAKIAASALLPHDIIKEALKDEADDDAMVVAELQWKRMVADLKCKGTLTDSIAVCDVSGSMAGIPMEVCIALGLLVSEISEHPWKGQVITFSSQPQLHIIEGSTLREKILFTSKMDWGFNTNLQAVFDKILDQAKASDLPPERMIKRLFIFSDMEFDQASENPWKTDYEVICAKFQAAGYGSPPQVVFWNLRHSSSTPVLAEQEGVALVSGFSKNLLKGFMERGNVKPMETMLDAINDKLYEGLVVVD